MSLRVNHVGLCVSDLEASLRFYRDALGFEQKGELRVKGEPADTLLRLRDVAMHALYLHRDGLTIELLHYASPGHLGDGTPRPMNALGFTHLSLQVDDLDALVSDLAAHGFSQLDDTRIENPAMHARAVFVTDPDGTLVELVESR
jgi:catechol 2,3-dioxygenase-like lactoylglutathione lyase family enzyme